MVDRGAVPCTGRCAALEHRRAAVGARNSRHKAVHLPHDARRDGLFATIRT